MLRASSFRLHFAALSALVVAGLATPALAQSPVCQEGQGHLQERQTLMQQFNKTMTKDRKIDPRGACPVLGKMVSNADNLLKWASTNKDWCQIPDQMVESLTAEQDKLKSLRTQACQAAAKIAEMEKQARTQQQQGGGGLLGGNSLTGEYKIPRGAL